MSKSSVKKESFGWWGTGAVGGPGGGWGTGAAGCTGQKPQGRGGGAAKQESSTTLGPSQPFQAAPNPRWNRLGLGKKVEALLRGSPRSGSCWGRDTPEGPRMTHARAGTLWWTAVTLVWNTSLSLARRVMLCAAQHKSFLLVAQLQTLVGWKWESGDMAPEESWRGENYTQEPNLRKPTCWQDDRYVTQRRTGSKQWLSN